MASRANFVALLLLAGCLGGALATGGRWFSEVSLDQVDSAFCGESDAGALSGSAVGSAGDFDGDSYHDAILGAPNSTGSAGKAYVMFGSNHLTFPYYLGLARAVTLSGAAAGNQLGSSVAHADVNGDGLSDAIVGAPGAGEAYVVFGFNSSSTRTALTPANLTGAVGLRVTCGTLCASSVAGAGDLNKDGFEDFVVGAQDWSYQTGRAYVVFGRNTSSWQALLGASGVLDVTSGTFLTSGLGFVVQGSSTADRLGYSVSAAGDIDGDGYADLAVGAPGANRAYVIFGSNAAAIAASGKVVTAPSSYGFAVTCSSSGAPTGCGFVVHGVGDITGDGVSDLVIGAPSSLDTTVPRVLAVFGHKGTWSTAIDYASLTGSAGALFVHEGTSASVGRVVDAVGDVNGDSYADFAVGDQYTGGATIVFGRATWRTGAQALTITDGLNGTQITSTLAGYCGGSVAGIGDFDGDAMPDIAVACPRLSCASALGAKQSGITYIVSGDLPPSTAADISSLTGCCSAGVGYPFNFSAAAAFSDNVSYARATLAVRLADDAPASGPTIEWIQTTGRLMWGTPARASDIGAAQIVVRLQDASHGYAEQAMTLTVAQTLTATNLDQSVDASDGDVDLLAIVVSTPSANATVTAVVDPSSAGSVSSLDATGGCSASSADGTWTASGPLACLNTLLAKLTYERDSHKDFTLTVTITDVYGQKLQAAMPGDGGSSGPNVAAIVGGVVGGGGGAILLGCCAAAAYVYYRRRKNRYAENDSGIVMEPVHS